MAGLPGGIGSLVQQTALQAGAEGKQACAGVNPDIFYGPDPDLRREPNEDKESREALALATCGRCQLRWPCLEWALREDESWGIWGGMTAPERAAFKKYLKRTSRGPMHHDEFHAVATGWLTQFRNNRPGPVAHRNGSGSDDKRKASA